MNIFVVLIPEEYDQYEIDMPYPIITNMTKQQCEQWLIDMADAACVYSNMDKRTQRYLPEPTFKLGIYELRLHQIIKSDNGKSIPYIPRLLELNEWLLEANINKNREKPKL